MKVRHVALVCRSEENADRFYRDLLGLERTRSFPVPVELSRGLFGFDRSFLALTYLKDDMTFEIFVVEEAPVIRPYLHHVGLEVEDRERFLERCGQMQVEIMEVPKGEKIITMIKDFDGNVFEIMEKV